MKRSILLAGLSAALLTVGPLRAEPNPVDFTDTSLAAGPLTALPGWKINVQAPANAGFEVRPGSGLALTENTGGTHAASYAFHYDREIPLGRDTFDAGSPLWVTADFVITQQPGPHKGPILGLGWGLFFPVGLNNVPVFAEFARDTAGGGYRLRLAKSGDRTTVSGETVVMIPEEALGLGAGDLVSDPLQMAFFLTNLGEKSEWESVCALTNLTTKKSFLLRNQIKAPGVYKTDDLLRGLINLRRAGEDGLSSVLLLRLDAEPAVDPAAP